jgi:hypothetical protein
MLLELERAVRFGGLPFFIARVGLKGVGFSPFINPAK